MFKSLPSDAWVGLFVAMLPSLENVRSSARGFSVPSYQETQRGDIGMIQFKLEPLGNVTLKVGWGVEIFLAIDGAVEIAVIGGLVRKARYSVIENIMNLSVLWGIHYRKKLYVTLENTVKKQPGSLTLLQLY